MQNTGGGLTAGWGDPGALPQILQGLRSELNLFEVDLGSCPRAGEVTLNRRFLSLSLLPGPPRGSFRLYSEATTCHWGSEMGERGSAPEELMPQPRDSWGDAEITVQPGRCRGRGEAGRGWWCWWMEQLMATCRGGGPRGMDRALLPRGDGEGRGRSVRGISKAGPAPHVCEAERMGGQGHLGVICEAAVICGVHGGRLRG